MKDIMFDELIEISGQPKVIQGTKSPEWWAENHNRVARLIICDDVPTDDPYFMVAAPSHHFVNVIDSIVFPKPLPKFDMAIDAYYTDDMHRED